MLLIEMEWENCPFPPPLQELMIPGWARAASSSKAIYFLTWEVLGIQLEELALLCGLKAVLFQVVRIESAFFKVLLDSRCNCFQEECFGSQWCVCACRSSVVHIGLELEASQVWNNKFWDLFLYLHKLPA